MTCSPPGSFRGMRSHLSVSPSRYVSLAFFSLLVFALASPASSSPLSAGVANYSIDVRLNPASQSLDASEVLVWHNSSAQSADNLYFHLYPNAFRSGNTTFMMESGRKIPSRARGRIDILNFMDMRSNENLTGQIRYISPDDGNLHDSTVMMVQLPRPVRPGDSIAVSIDFHEQLPEDMSGTGWAPGQEFYFVARWFPKIGVFQNGEWNCHQLHAFGGSFADFGTYDVKINAPPGYTLGATGVRVGESMKSNGSITYHFVADSVQDFAWTASANMITETRTFDYPGLPSTKVILLLQLRHRSQVERYFAAVDTAMKYFGLWYGPYPYSALTVVDPPRAVRVAETQTCGGCGCGMVYPGLIVAGTSDYTLKHEHTTEAAIISGIGYQYWNGMVAGNGFENAWLGDGLNAYSSGKIFERVYGAEVSVFRVGGVYPVYMFPLVTFGGVPVAAIPGKILVHEPYAGLPLYLRHEKADAISSVAYRALDEGSYRSITCNKPDLVLRTLEGVVGKGVMRNIMRTYFEKYIFKHPTGRDFQEVCDQVSGQNLDWFFNEFAYGSATVDFAVKSIDYYKVTDLSTGMSSYVTRVMVARNGGVKMPVDLRLSLSDGSAEDTVWNGQSRWKAFTFRSGAPPDYAVVDPSNKIPLDTDYANNSRRVNAFLTPVIKWIGRIVSYFQNVLLNIGALA